MRVRVESNREKKKSERKPSRKSQLRPHTNEVYSEIKSHLTISHSSAQASSLLKNISVRILKRTPLVIYCIYVV